MAVTFPTEYAGLVQIEDYAAEAVADLLGVFQDKPRIEALLSAYANRITELEADAFKVLYLLTNLEAAADATYGGPWLERFGQLVGQKQEGSDNATWAAFIRARIAANKSNGTPADLIAIMLLLFGQGSNVRYEEYFPKAATLTLLDDVGEIDPIAVYRLLRDAKPAGTRLDLIYGSGFSPLTAGFTWGHEGDYPEDDTARGWGTIGADGIDQKDFDGTLWGGIGGVTAGQADPLGGTNAFLLDDTSTAFQEDVTIGVTSVAGETYRAEVLVKMDSDESRFPALVLFNGGNPYVEIHLNTATGVTALASSVGFTGVSYGAAPAAPWSGWWRFWVEVTNTTPTSLSWTIFPAAGSVLGTADGTVTGSMTAYNPRFLGPGTVGGRWTSVVGG